MDDRRIEVSVMARNETFLLFTAFGPVPYLMVTGSVFLGTK
jgi:hypothetical protein